MGSEKRDRIDVPVKRMGKTRISQMLVPFAAWMEAMPRRATSDEVSKPRPKRMPRGYIFQGLWSLVMLDTSTNPPFNRSLRG